MDHVSYPSKSCILNVFIIAAQLSVGRRQGGCDHKPTIKAYKHQLRHKRDKNWRKIFTFQEKPKRSSFQLVPVEGRGGCTHLSLLHSLKLSPLLAFAWFLLLCVSIYVCTITVLFTIREFIVSFFGLAAIKGYIRFQSQNCDVDF